MREKITKNKDCPITDTFLMLQSVEQVFGKEDMTRLSSNSHIPYELAPVVHFPLSIWCLGPLYTNSTFMLEDLMGTLMSSIHGGKANMDHKALENWSIHQMTSLKRKFTFQYEKGDIVMISGQTFEIIKIKREGGYKLMKLSDKSLHLHDHIGSNSLNAIPCFVVQGKVKPVYHNDLFLL